MRRPCGCYDTDYSRDMAIVRTGTQWGFLIAALLFLALIPAFASGYILTVLIYIGIGVIVALGLNLLVGYCGQISVGQSAFMGAGGFAAAHVALTLFNGASWAFWVALPLSGITAGLVGLIFGFPSLRVKGFYLALTTLAAQFIIQYVLIHFAGGETGLHVKSPAIGSFIINTDQKYYYLVMVFALLAIVLSKNITRGRIGRTFLAIRDNEISAEALGINIFRYKLLAFFIGCFFAGIGGCLWVFYLGLASVEHYTLQDSIWYLGMIIVGGMGSTLGTVLGVFFIQGVRELSYLLAQQVSQIAPALSSNIIGSLPIMVFSIVVALFLIFEPRGLAHRWELFKASYRIWPFGHL